MMVLASISLALTYHQFIVQTTNNETVNFANLSGHIVIYIYPLTGRPDTALPHAAY